ncbi:hypothetical protein M441DRAFT_62203 [Trichoderma asperellum CBS 433.97]|uniref:Uncharacterized protein n=1 Tax=Trichoderma asperellum (strain ATCC 204424 / CBS 433.97 / NBRC 101777) TaxID=1042311 RepID=A0A2T3YUG1_TRIA4|nr:hypothetical protein M441DRAFT_62203 [Trichoderma asperellum CBS 433.97]PTB36213.1 hypothetical protein M441DRAFT_62203 [Trichoderma asperellum CBS 433.97]
MVSASGLALGYYLLRYSASFTPCSSDLIRTNDSAYISLSYHIKLEPSVLLFEPDVNNALRNIHWCERHHTNHR